jgi:hypothetical protein
MIDKAMIFFVCFSLSSSSVLAKPVNKSELPDKIIRYLDKKYPAAKQLDLSEKKHFDQTFLELTFQHPVDPKHTETLIKLFKPSGVFFTNVIAVDKNAFRLLPDATSKALEARYPNHKILEMNLIANPNKAGEEYEMVILVDKDIFHVSMDDQGKLISETLASQ